MRRRAPGNRARALLRRLHRWFGLTVGLLFTAVAVSGSLLLFQPLFFEWAHGEMIPPGLAQKPGSVDAWVANASAAAPPDGRLIAIWRPHIAHNLSDAAMLVYTGLEPGGLGNMGFAAVLVAPATGALLGSFNIDRSPAYAPLFFHRDLWAGASGRVISAIMAIGTAGALLIGLYLWWPPRKRLQRKLSPRPWRATLANALRLHNWTGVWMLAGLMVLTLSGLYLVQPTWVAPALGLLPEAQAQHAQARVPCPGRIGFDAALTAAQELVPSGRWTAIYPHDPAQGQWEITMRTGGDTNVEHGDTHLLADLDCGRVTVHETAATRGARHTVEAWLVGLHDGSVFGRPGEIAVSLLGLTPLILSWTGIRIWLRRRRSANRLSRSELPR